MKNLLIILFSALAITGCRKEEPKCRPYLDAVRDGTIPRKTTTVTLTDSLKYELDYVRDQDYKDYPHFCYGHLELNKTDFTTALAAVTKKYNADSTHHFYMLAQGADLCNNAPLKADQIKYLQVHYIDKYNNGWLDFINLSNDKTTSYRDSGYASVAIYLLMKKSGITNLPSTTEFRNKDFDRLKIKRVKPKDDPLYRLANP